MSLLDTNAGALSAPARKAAEACARKLFAARGNHSEIHLNEYELALACAAAGEVALTLADKQYTMADVATEVRKATADALATIERLTRENEALQREVVRLRHEFRFQVTV